MKDLLYLKDEQIKDFIQLLSYAHRETFSDPKKILAKKWGGRILEIKRAFFFYLNQNRPKHHPQNANF